LKKLPTKEYSSALKSTSRVPHPDHEEQGRLWAPAGLSQALRRFYNISNK
jgi:hypothetical protein